MKLSAPADCEAMLDELLNQSIALVSKYKIKQDRSIHSCRDRWQVSYLSSACKAMYGYCAAELVADQELWRSRLHSADWESAQTAIDRSLRSNSLAVTRDFRVHHADGSWRWLRESLTFRHDAIDGWIATAIAVEISDRQQIEAQAKAIDQLQAQLSAEGERYQLATAAAKVGMWEWNLQTGEFYLDPTVKALLGYADAEIPNSLDWLNHIYPDDRPLVQAAVQAHLDRHTPEYCCEHRMRHKDGSIRWILVRGVAIRNAAGEAVRMVGTDADISDRKQAEAQLQSLIAGTAAVTGKDFFSALAQHIAAALEVAYVVVAELSDTVPLAQSDTVPGALRDRTLNTLAFWAHGERQTNISYLVAQTPCEITIAQGFFCCPAGVQTAFPADLDLVEMQAESYLGIALKDAQGQTIGELCLLDTRPLQQPQQVEEILRVFAARAAAELERQRATTALERLNDELEAKVIDRTVQLQQSKAKLHDVLNGAITTSIFSCFLLADRTWKYDTISIGCETVFGYTAAEVLADPSLWSARVFPEDMEAIMLPAIERMFTEETVAIEYRFHHLDNSLRWISAVYTARWDEAATCRIVVGVSNDITDRKRLEVDRQQAQLELQAQKDFLQRVINFVPGCIFVKDMQGRLQLANVAMADLYGRSIETVLGKRLTEFSSHLSSAQHEQFEAEDLQVIQTGQSLVKQDRIPTIQGQDRWYQVTLKPFIDPQGQIQGVIGNSIDITDRKLAELALQQSEERFRQLAETIQDVFWMSTTSGDDMIYVSPAFERIWGETCDALYQSPYLWIERVHPDDRSAIWAAFQAEKSQGYDQQYRIIRPDGEIRWIHDRAFVVRNAAGEAYRLAGVAADITPFKQIESALQRSQQQYQMLVNSIDAIVWQGELRGTEFEFTFVSQQAERILGYSIDRWYESNFWSSHLHSEDCDRAIAYCTSCIEAQQDHVHEYRMQAADGRFVWIEDKTQVIVENNQVQQVIGLFTDVSDRKRAEIALQRSQQQYQMLVNSVDAIVWRGQVRDSEFEFTFVSQQAEQIFGYPIDRWQESNFWLSHIHFDDRDRVLEYCVACIETDQDQMIEYRMQAANGRYLWIEDKAKVISKTEGIYQLIGLLTDISDRKQTELLLQQQQQTLRAIINNAPLWIWMLDRKRKSQLVNQTLIQDIGITEAEFLAVNDYVELLGAEVAQPCLASDAACWEANAPVRSIETLVLADGQPHTLEVIKTQLKDANGVGTHLIGLALDVSDRIAVETALRQSEETLRLVVQNMPVMLDAYDEHGNLIVWNRECERVTGFSAEEIIHNSNSLELLYPEPNYRAQMLREWTEHSGDFRDWEWDITCKDGTRKTILWSNVSQEFAIPGWAGWAIGINISDRKAAERSLRQSEERYRTLVDNLPGVVYRCAHDRNWTAHYLSDRIFEITGFSASDLMAPSARTFSSIIHPDDIEALWDRTERAVALGGVHQDEYRIIHANGEIRWILDREQVCYAPDGSVLWVDGILFDITDRKRTEDQLRDLSDRLSLAIKSGAIGVWEWEIATNTLIWDDRTCELYGIDRSNFTGASQDWSLRVHPDDLLAAEAITQKALRGEQDYDTEFRVVLPDRTIRFLKACAIVQREAGEPQRMIGINIDVSAQRQAEAKLRQANETLAIANLELARANRLKDEFLANMSHELRTPLSAMLGLSRALQAETFGSLNDKQRQFVETISSSGDHLLALINDILDLAKIESGRFDLEFAAVLVDSLCQTSLAVIEPLAEQKNITLKADLPPSCFAVLDERRICQVLINLLSNAVKFTPAGGQVRLEVKIESSSLRFSVIDTGIGIAPADQALLFEPFVQIDSSLSRHHEGTGLGLALVKQIVELHDGSVAVESQLGKGSCFSVTLPCRGLSGI